MPVKKKPKTVAPATRRGTDKPREMQVAYLIEAGLLLVLMGGGTIFTMSYLRRETPVPQPPPPPVMHIPDIIEMEGLRVTGKSREFVTMVQDMSPFHDGTWSGNQQYFAADTQPGDWVEWALPDTPGHFTLSVYFTKARDYGIVQMEVNGRKVGPPQDLISGNVISTGPVELGRVTLKAKDNRIRVVVTGVNSTSATHTYFFGIDGIRLAPVK
jgi:hypothetical protein